MTGNFFVDNYFLQNYKICKYFLQNLLQKVFYTKYFAKKLVAISCNLFYNKNYKYFLKKKFKTKLAENMNSFSSETKTKSNITNKCWDQIKILSTWSYHIALLLSGHTDGVTWHNCEVMCKKIIIKKLTN